MECYFVKYWFIVVGVTLSFLSKSIAGPPQFPRGREGEKDSGCGLRSIDPTQTHKIQTPYSQYGYYPSNYECTWRFIGTQGCQPLVNCASFDIEKSNDCSKDYLQLSDGSDSYQKFCGKAGPNNVASTSTILIATFRSGVHFGTEKGFNCIVSCAPDANFTDTHITYLTYQPPKTADCKCGVPGNSASSQPQRIVGGTDAPIYRWKWQAALQIRNRKGPFCGGSLINDRFILTAAHCVVTTGLLVAPTAMVVILNDYNISTTSETKTITKDVISIISHPLYNTASQDYDVALLELSSPVELTASEEPYVNPVCLPQRGNRNTFAGENGTVTGWGTTTEGGDQPDVLQQADIPVITNELCNKQYEDRITERMICAAYPEGKIDSCQGDSGGPFVYNNNGRYSEIGIVSFGEGCARKDRAGVYSRVTDLNDWIRMTARSGTWCQEL